MTYLHELLRIYMAEKMAMASIDSDQEQNWIAGHMSTFTQGVLDASGRSIAPAQPEPQPRPSGPHDSNRDARTPVRE